jgi:putative transcriptional regulator
MGSDATGFGRRLQTVSSDNGRPRERRREYSFRLAMTETLRGHLLIAAPSLLDYFRRTVVLVIEHSDEGAMGVVLGRASETPVAEAVPMLADLAAEGELVHLGGPVSPDSVVALGDFEDPSEAGTSVIGSLGLLDPDAPEPTVRKLRVYAGYAGWGPGQLDDELEQGAWIVEPADADDPFRDGDVWAEVLQRKGGNYSLLATMPADPSLN